MPLAAQENRISSLRQDSPPALLDADQRRQEQIFHAWSHQLEQLAADVLGSPRRRLTPSIISPGAVAHERARPSSSSKKSGHT
jgi:hypothetical protein